MSEAELINELQTRGIRLVDPTAGMESRRGGAGPTDHKAVTVGDTTVMVPVHTAPAFESPYVVQAPSSDGISEITKRGRSLGNIRLPMRPKFYDLKTADGVEYHKIAALHSKDVLATTILQTCIRYESRKKTCQFCSIGQSLAAGRTIARKTPAQLAEVAKAAVELDGVKHMVMTTGTPAGKDRGASVMVESAVAVKAAVDLPIQGQCEPPEDNIWHEHMFNAGIDALGMHLEAVTPEVRQRIMPGKAQVSLEKYFDSFKSAVKIFGRGQVSTYILAGLGDTSEAILKTSQELCKIGVYPFVVPFVPVSGTPLESHPAPTSDFMAGILKPLSGMILRAGMSAESSKAGCAKCGACSALSTYEKLRVS
ncbi:MSMEG_0568 family radical SAM protein [Shimia marina]|uniref:Radical SAM protein, family n=1 Tax=Shimia marina TaxID=321267 RepID=A0A0P1EKZ7_9RHOB|nr:MSMEG_0568 family radical SAM protein [Shimia marina]CUH50802.1 radical SAM protein, family [Shimia marina]SFE66288.1 radical SAM protein, MSMEG_0568 family [Shimia marina]